MMKIRSCYSFLTLCKTSYEIRRFVFRVMVSGLPYSVVKMPGWIQFNYKPEGGKGEGENVVLKGKIRRKKKKGGGIN
jgi:hypothetical protein